MEIAKVFPKSGQKEVYLVYVCRIKMLTPILLKIVKVITERAVREVNIVRKNNILGVPKILEIKEISINGQRKVYWFEEYIEGSTLSNVLRIKGKLSLIEGIRLLEYLLKVECQLEEIHVVHRDIKPDNIIVDKNGCYHLIDFGIARDLNLSSLTRTETAVGPHTPGYGAPELFQYCKEEIDSRSDLFSIGVVVYEALIGKHPFLDGTEKNLEDVWYKIRTVIPTEEDITKTSNYYYLIGFLKTLIQTQISKRPPNARKALEWFYAIAHLLGIT